MAKRSGGKESSGSSSEAQDDEGESEKPREPKNIVLCSDGTGNSAAKANKTNVWRLYQALDLTTDRQIAVFDDGIGTSGSKLLKALGGAFGLGFSANIRELYRFLCQHYEPGDRIYIFGFSRGAFTARTLAGLIVTCGILDPSKPIGRGAGKVPLGTDGGLRKGVALAYKSYRRGYWAPVAWLFRLVRDFLFGAVPKPEAFRAAYGRDGDTKIAFLGVWDTVDALGLPIDELSVMVDKIIYPHRFSDQNLSDKVERACHAVAVDDERHTFHPVLWNEKAEAEAERIKQVWFTGMHGNVGGGYPDDDLAHNSLGWMIGEVKRNGKGEGLDFDSEAVRDIARRASALGKIHDSRSGFAVYYRYKPRRVDTLTHDAEARVFIEEPKIHHSVFDRIAENTAGYAPAGLPASYRVVSAKGVVSKLNPETYERSLKRERRAKFLDRAQSLIFWRRLLYFAMVAVTLGLVLLPHFFPPVPGLVTQGLEGIIQSVFEFLAPFLPDFLDFWTEGWSQSPVLFIVLVVLLLLLNWLRRRLATHTQRLSEAAWWHVKAVPGNKPEVPESAFEKLATALRRSAPLKALFEWINRRVVPILALVLFLFVLAGLGYRLFVHLPETRGGLCGRWMSKEDAWVASSAEVSRSIVVETRDPCTDTGVTLYAGEKYAIEVGITEPWMDHERAAGPTGLEPWSARFQWRYLAGLAARRKVLLPWFALIGEIGLDSGNSFPIPVSGAGRKITFRPKATGQLYLYVNDAINSTEFEVPGCDGDGCRAWHGFYGNNRGKAKVTITRER